MKTNPKLLLLIIIAICVSSINFACKKDEKVPVKNTGDTTKELKSKDIIKFVKQGEVYFQDSTKRLIKQIDVELAETDERRHLGLMFREKMEENQGMLFIFPYEEEQSFYMRNTLIPLDIIFINSKKKIVKIWKNTTPLSEKSLPSGKPSQYVVEVIGGFTTKYNIKEGDYIDYKKN